MGSNGPTFSPMRSEPSARLWASLGRSAVPAHCEPWQESPPPQLSGYAVYRAPLADARRQRGVAKKAQTTNVARACALTPPAHPDGPAQSIVKAWLARRRAQGDNRRLSRRRPSDNQMLSGRTWPPWRVRSLSRRDMRGSGPATAMAKPRHWLCCGRICLAAPAPNASPTRVRPACTAPFSRK